MPEGPAQVRKEGKWVKTKIYVIHNVFGLQPLPTKEDAEYVADDLTYRLFEKYQINQKFKVIPTIIKKADNK
jgi:hypothetical protein